VGELANSGMILTRFIWVFGRTSFALFMALYLAHLEVNRSSFTPDLFSSLALCQHAHRFFHLGVHVTFYLHFWGYIKIFGGAMYPLTLLLGVQRKWTAFSPHKVVHHAVFL
jgi:hypothetical protein